MMELDCLPVVWEVRVRCMQFWYKVLTSKIYEGRLLRKVVLQVVECGRGSWMRSIGRCIGRFGWQDMSGGVVWELSEAEVKMYVAECGLEKCKGRMEEGSARKAKVVHDEVDRTEQALLGK